MKYFVENNYFFSLMKNLRNSIYTTTVKGIIKNKNVIKFLKTPTHEDIELLKTALTKGEIWQYFFNCKNYKIIIIL